ncbi:BA75_02359T0 [Komagataella pastoris]|uniref:BA75_02359T0 n=1 Tax=Komagataella pastoris TaxID=4922 RepID=A0A1B2JDA2_PICPA|nr:BA75_02359T0 [Komagataella pastoris]
MRGGTLPRLYRSSYRRSTAPAGVPLAKVFSNSFPRSFIDSLSDYKDRLQLDKFQNELLSLLSFFPDGDNTRKVRILKVPVSRVPSETGFINEVCIYPKGRSHYDPNLKHLLLVHGYGAGLGFFLKNLDRISEYGCSNGWMIHAIDLYGYGCSSRPQFPCSESLSSSVVTEWFTQTLRQWFEKRVSSTRDDTLVVAHSMGAYLCALFNMQHPEFFNRLVMCSPAGISVPESDIPIPTWFNYLWNKNVSPFFIVRYANILGSKLVSGWTSRRFACLTPFEQEALHRYAYGIFNAPGSGEYVLNYLLAAGGIPRNPLRDAIEKLKCDLCWVYGEDDWMDVHGGRRCHELMNENRSNSSEYYVVPNSGHHLYLDNHSVFNDIVVSQMKKYN